jgi:hypothetical protein
MEMQLGTGNSGWAWTKSEGLVLDSPGFAAPRLPWVGDIPTRPEPWRGSLPAWLTETGSIFGLLMAKMPVEFGSLSIRLPRRKPAPTGLRRSGCPVTQGSRKAANPGLSKNVPSGHGLAHRPLPDFQPFSCLLIAIASLCQRPRWGICRMRRRARVGGSS